MNKAVLILDYLPDSCVDCELRDPDTNHCKITGDYHFSLYNLYNDNRPISCPLVEAPNTTCEIDGKLGFKKEDFTKDILW